jgi:ankyrin repeat protein
MKEIFLGLADNHNGLLFNGYTGGSYPGYPGSISLVGSSGIFPDFSARSSAENGDLLIALGLNPDLYPHLPAKMKETVALLNAVQKNDVAALKNLIAQGVDLKSIAGPDGSLLCYATSPEIAEVLLQHGIPVDAKDSQFQPALIHICRDYKRDHSTVAPVVSVLLKHGADPNSAVMGDSSTSALMLASDGPTVDALVVAGAKVPFMCGEHSARFAMSYRTADYYQALVRHGLDLKIGGPFRGEQGLYILIRACEAGGKDDLVEWLINQGVDPDGIFYFGDYPKGLPKTPLIQCAESGNVATAKILIQYGMKLDQVVRDGKTEGELAMAAAVKTNNTQLISILQAAEANNGASPDTKDAYALVQVVMFDLPENDYQENRRVIDDAVHRGDFTTLQNLFHSQPGPLRLIRTKLPVMKWSHTSALVTGSTNPALTFTITPSRAGDKINLVGSVTVNHKHWYDRSESKRSLQLGPLQSYPIDATLTPLQFQAIPDGGILEPLAAREPDDQKPYRLFLFFRASARQQPSPDDSSN